MTAIDFESSGQRIDVSLEDVAAMALLYGFERPGPHSDTKPAAQRANLSDFFNVYGVNAFSKFKDKFRRETLLPPEEQKAMEHQKAIDAELNRYKFPEVTEAEFQSAIEQHDRMNRKWRIFKKPGGVAVRPEIFYEILGAKMHVESGDCTEEEPQWNDLGAVDYVGKAIWRGHTGWKGKSKEEAMAGFVALSKKAKHNYSDNFFV